MGDEVGEGGGKVEGEGGERERGSKLKDREILLEGNQSSNFSSLVLDPAVSHCVHYIKRPK